MQGRSLIAELPKKVGEKVIISGWLWNNRDLGKIAFLLVKDRSGIVQVVLEEKEQIKEFSGLQPGSIVYLEGLVKESANTDLGVEIVEAKVKLGTTVKEAWPVEINKPELKASIDTILDNRALTLRHQKNAAIFKIQATFAQSYREYMIANGFAEFFGPAMLASSSEGGAEIFKFDYFGKTATLAQSNQLYKQIMVGVYERVFSIAKWFRAENSNTRRHLTEGMQFEFELGFIEKLEDIWEHLEGVIRFMYAVVLEKNRADLDILEVELAKLPEGNFPAYKFEEAIKIVAEITGEDTSSWVDLTTESERVLCDYAREKYGSDFIFISNYRKGVFYAYKDEDGQYWNFDLLCREAEIVSGGRRIDNHDDLVQAIKTAGMDPSAFSEYLSIFKYGMPPHGGFGMGFERFTMLSLGLDNIRLASAFPSDPKRVASQSLPEKVVNGAVQIKKEIKNLFIEADLQFQVLNHDKTATSEESEGARGTAIKNGVKALILREKKSGVNILVAIRAHQKLNIKAVEATYAADNPHLTGAVKFTFESPETIQEKFGLKIGCVPPFGEVFGLKTYIDSAVLATSEISKDVEVGESQSRNEDQKSEESEENQKDEESIRAFNNADLTQSIICSSDDLAKVLTGKIGDFAI